MVFWVSALSLPWAESVVSQHTEESLPEWICCFEFICLVEWVLIWPAIHLLQLLLEWKVILQSCFSFCFICVNVIPYELPWRFVLTAKKHNHFSFQEDWKKSNHSYLGDDLFKIFSLIFCSYIYMLWVRSWLCLSQWQSSHWFPLGPAITKCYFSS